MRKCYSSIKYRICNLQCQYQLICCCNDCGRMDSRWIDLNWFNTKTLISTHISTICRRWNSDLHQIWPNQADPDIRWLRLCGVRCEGSLPPVHCVLLPQRSQVRLDCLSPRVNVIISRNVITKKWQYWESYWSYVEWFIILVSISAIGFYFYKEFRIWISLGFYFLKAYEM